MKALYLFVMVGILVQSIAAATIGSSPVQKLGASAAGSSFLPSFSGDGRTLIFVSHANNLVTNDDAGPSLDVFARDLVGSNTVLVSVSTNGIGGANADVQDPVVSHDGRFVAFASRASNLVLGDTNNSSDVFLRDISNGTTRLVSVAVTGGSPKDPRPTANAPLSSSPMISADGRWVIFESRATNLMVTPTPLNSVNIYARDTWSNVTTLVTVSTNGFALSGTQQLSGISADGRYVAFLSTNLDAVAGATNSGIDAYVRDLQTAETIWASRNATLLGSNTYYIESFALSADGHYAAMNVARPFYRTVPMRQDLQNAGAFVPVVYSYPGSLQLSSDGRYLLYEREGLIVHDFSNQTNRSIGWISLHLDCSGANPPVCEVDGSFAGQMTPDGRFVAFAIAEDPSLSYGQAPVHVYIRDLWTGVSNLVVVTTNGLAKDFKYRMESFVVSPDGQRVAWDSFAADLALNDLNGASDVFVRNIASGTTEVISAPHPQRTASTPFAQSFLTPNSISADGDVITSLRYDDPSARETNRMLDVFVRVLSSNTSYAVSISTNGAYTNLFGVLGSAGDTNLYRAPMVSADGSTIAAVRGPALSAGFLGASAVAAGRVSNRDFSEMRLVHLAHGEAPSLSSDGMLMAFSSIDPSVDPFGNDRNGGWPDIWLAYFQAVPPWYDYRGSFPITLGFGVSGNGQSVLPQVSPDGARVAYVSRSSNLAPFVNADSGSPFINYHVLVNTFGTNRAATNFLLTPWQSNLLVSYSSIVSQPFTWMEIGESNVARTNINFQFVPANIGATNPVFSADGRFLFYSLGDESAIYRHDFSALHTNVSRNPTNFALVVSNTVPGVENALACTNGRALSVNADGTVIAFERARNATGTVDIVVKSFVTGEESLVSVSSIGAPGDGASAFPSISGDGRYVIFESRARNLIASDGNNASDIFVRDRLLGVTMLVSANAHGQPGNGPSSRPVLAANGRTVIFQSLANDLAANDYNDRRDIFVLTLSSADSDGDGMNDDWEVAYFGNLSHDGGADSDGDGASDLAEFQAGTDPTNLNSAFRVLIVSPSGGGSRQLLWNGNPARTYRAEYKESVSAIDWTPLDGSVSWNGTTASIVDTTATNNFQRYYRAVLLP